MSTSDAPCRQLGDAMQQPSKEAKQDGRAYEYQHERRQAVTNRRYLRPKHGIPHERETGETPHARHGGKNGDGPK